MPEPVADGGPPAEPIRLQLFIARAGIASRRAAERLIEEGRVSVNGTVVRELGTKVLPSDRVEVDGRALVPEERLRYILLNKPAGHICAMSDPEGRPLAVDLLKPAVAERVYNVGRLDQWSSGLVLFTNDGELAARMGHPSGGFEKEYQVEADADLPEAFFTGFRSGLLVEGTFYKAQEVGRLGPRSARIVLVEGKNREIRRVLEHFGRRALRLVRLRIGPLDLRGLPEGSWRELGPEELRSLGVASRT